MYLFFSLFFELFYCGSLLATFLEELLDVYGSDILADDALFELGNIYENHLLNSDKAGEYYKKILFEHKDSLYTAEARKRYQNIKKISQSNSGLQ